jgi:hypothetical protein
MDVNHDEKRMFIEGKSYLLFSAKWRKRLKSGVVSYRWRVEKSEKKVGGVQIG